MAETIQAKRQRLSQVARACEACKIRKIRCDRSSPCSNCLASGITCQIPENGSKSRPASDDITHLKEHIKRLDERLSIVEARITSQNSRFEPPIRRQAQGESRSNHKESLSSTTHTNPQYEGTSSFSHQSIEATGTARKNAQRTAGLATDLDHSSIGASLSSLKSLLRGSSSSPSREQSRFCRNRSLTAEPDIVSLPSNFVIAMLRSIEDRRPVFLYSYPLNDTSMLQTLCQKVYFPVAAISNGHVTAMHAILYFILKEYIALSDPLCKEFDLKDYLSRCEQIVNTGLETYEIIAMPTFENILALTMGVIKAHEEGKPVLCSTLISMTASQCQILGFHRETTYTRDQSGHTESKRRIFWTIYVFDKQLSLLSGRASHMQDVEIDANYPKVSLDPASRPWDESFIVAIKMARVQGRIYNDFYSTAAMKSSQSARMQHVESLTPALQQLRVDLEQIDGSHVTHPHVFQLSRNHWDVMYYSSLTTLLRASSNLSQGMEISPQCLEAALLSLQSHIRCFSNYRESGIVSDDDYANWFLYCASFTPFIVVFLHIIETNSSDHLDLLDKVVGILQSTQGGSKNSERFHQICASFARLARDLVSAQNSNIALYNCQGESISESNETRRISTFQSGSNQSSTSERADGVAGWNELDVADFLQNYVDGGWPIINIFESGTLGNSDMSNE